jgi:hypothetical protein
MANTFTRKLSRLTGTAATTVGGYTVPSATTAVVVGLSLTNVTSSAIAANVSILDNASQTTNLAVNAPISAGSSLVVGGGDQKIVLVTGDQLQVQSSAATSIDVVMSIMEIT